MRRFMHSTGADMHFWHCRSQVSVSFRSPIQGTAMSRQCSFCTRCAQLAPFNVVRAVPMLLGRRRPNTGAPRILQCSAPGLRAPVWPVRKATPQHLKRVAPVSATEIQVHSETSSSTATSSKDEYCRVTEADDFSVRGVTTAPQCTLSQAIKSLIQVSELDAKELICLGAVYLGEFIKGQDYVKWRRYAGSTSLEVQEGTLIRAHPHPKRFPACYTTSWHAAVVHLDEDFLVLNKPAGLPCMCHESNGVEEVAGCAARALGLGPGLEVCHRLDQWTTGVLVLSRHKDANRRFKQALQDKEHVVKIYKAITRQPVQLGRLVHHMYDGPFNQGAPVLGGGNLRPRGPRLLSLEPHPTWKMCDMEVLECRACPEVHSWCSSSIFPSPFAPSDASSPDAPQLYESTIRLYTGRTHQIRAQLAAIGCPLVGDRMYEKIPELLVDGTGVVSDPELVKHIEGLPQLNGHIGLHAWRLEWEGHQFTAAAPWSVSR